MVNPFVGSPWKELREDIDLTEYQNDIGYKSQGLVLKIVWREKAPTTSGS